MATATCKLAKWVGRHVHDAVLDVVDGVATWYPFEEGRIGKTPHE